MNFIWYVKEMFTTNKINLNMTLGSSVMKIHLKFIK